MKSIKSRKKLGRPRKSKDNISSKKKLKFLQDVEKHIEHRMKTHFKIMNQKEYPEMHFEWKQVEQPEITRSYITPLKNKIKELSNSASQWMNWIKRLIWP